MTKNKTTNIKGSKYMYVWMALFVLGGLAGSVFLIVEGLSFEYDYSIIYIFGGVIFFPIFLYLSICALPGLIPGKVLFSIDSGDNGFVRAKKENVSIKSIRNINLKRNPFNLMNDIVIETFNDKTLKIHTYNLLDDLQYEMIVDQYIYPYMDENAKKVWDRKIDLERLRKVARYERKEPKIE